MASYNEASRRDLSRTSVFDAAFRPEPYASGPVEASSSPHGPFGVASAPRFVPSEDSCGLFPAPNLPRHGSLECGAMSWLNPRRSSNSRTRVRLPPACGRQACLPQAGPR